MNKIYLSEGFKYNMFWACYRSGKMHAPLVGIGLSKTEALDELKAKVAEFKTAGRKI